MSRGVISLHSPLRPLHSSQQLPTVTSWQFCFRTEPAPPFFMYPTPEKRSRTQVPPRDTFVQLILSRKKDRAALRSRLCLLDSWSRVQHCWFIAYVLLGGLHNGLVTPFHLHCGRNQMMCVYQIGGTRRGRGATIFLQLLCLESQQFLVRFQQFLLQPFL